MKTISLVISFVFIFAIASAQSNISVIQLSKAPKAKLIGRSSFGKVYALPQDNMPCIIPAPVTAAVIPVAGSTAITSAAIPNAVPQQDMIAANPLYNNIFKPGTAPQETSKNLMLDLIRKK